MRACHLQFFREKGIRSYSSLTCSRGVDKYPGVSTYNFCVYILLLLEPVVAVAIPYVQQHKMSVSNFYRVKIFDLNARFSPSVTSTAARANAKKKRVVNLKYVLLKEHVTCFKR